MKQAKIAVLLMLSPHAQGLLDITAGIVVVIQAIDVLADGALTPSGSSSQVSAGHVAALHLLPYFAHPFVGCQIVSQFFHLAC